MENYIIKKQTATSMIIELDMANLGITNQKKIFGEGSLPFRIDENLTFIQDEDFIFDINTLIFFDLDPMYRLLRKGTYPLKVCQGKIQIAITLHPFQ